MFLSFIDSLEEIEPKGIRETLHERFIEALEASIVNDQTEIVLVLDRVTNLKSFHSFLACFVYDESTYSQ